jgi:hypothetical protein
MLDTGRRIQGASVMQNAVGFAFAWVFCIRHPASSTSRVLALAALPLALAGVFYTALGHRPEVWQDPAYQQHLAGGITWAIGGQ